jgi:V/A-type H+-transporting ATPase subunit D
LPTLQLKKQQLQLEILAQLSAAEEKEHSLAVKKKSASIWSGLLAEPQISLKAHITPGKIITGNKNVAGVDIPVFERAEFGAAEYDLFITPLWADAAIEALRGIVFLQEEIRVIRKGITILRHELRITTQRVNLFEKVKIPETKEAIRLIKIYIGDQMANAVGRSKIAKGKIESEAFLEGALL